MASANQIFIIEEIFRVSRSHRSHPRSYSCPTFYRISGPSSVNYLCLRIFSCQDVDLLGFDDQQKQKPGNGNGNVPN